MPVEIAIVGLTLLLIITTYLLYRMSTALQVNNK